MAEPAGAGDVEGGSIKGSEGGGVPELLDAC